MLNVKLLSKINFTSNFWLVLGNEDKIMICSFFKFSVLEHLWGLKWIAWVDIWVVLIYICFDIYSIYTIRFRAFGLIWKENLKNGQNVLEKWTKCNAVLKSPVSDATQKDETWGLIGSGQRRQRGYKEPTIWLWQFWEAKCDFFDEQIYNLYMSAI